MRRSPLVYGPHTRRTLVAHSGATSDDDHTRIVGSGVRVMGGCATTMSGGAAAIGSRAETDVRVGRGSGHANARL